MDWDLLFKFKNIWIVNLKIFIDFINIIGFEFFFYIIFELIVGF